jgi:pimeloyl-ACP methyl ester carboxylesterase
MNIKTLFWNTVYHNHNDLVAKRAPIRTIPESVKNITTLKILKQHVYLEIGNGKPLVFCHGIFGGIYNIEKLALLLKDTHKIIMPFLPMYDMPLHKCSIAELGAYLELFLKDIELKETMLISSSMGGGASIAALSKNSESVKGLVLCGSSGLSTIPLSSGYFKRKNFDFIFNSTKHIFFNRSIPSEDMARDVFNCIQNPEIVLRAIRFTKSATNKRQDGIIPLIKIPTLLVWGKEDPITPIACAYEFKKLLPNSNLLIFDSCGHVPTQECPNLFYKELIKFMKIVKF